MPQYRIPELDLSTRIRLGLKMLLPIPERAWGQATELARTYGISRTLLYQFRDRAREGLIRAMVPRKPGPREEQAEVTLDRTFLRRVVTVLSMLKGSVRDIQLGLDLLFDVQRSVCCQRSKSVPLYVKYKLLSWHPCFNRPSACQNGSQAHSPGQGVPEGQAQRSP